MPGKMLKKSCVFTKMFLSFSGSKNECIIYILFSFYLSIKVILFTQQKVNIKLIKIQTFYDIILQNKDFIFSSTVYSEKWQ